MSLKLFVFFLFLGNLIIIPLYGWIVMDQMYVSSLPQQNLTSCTNTSVSRFGIWATVEMDCKGIMLQYPPPPWILNPHDVFKVRRWISICEHLSNKGKLVAYIDKAQKIAYLNGFETGAWSNLVEMVLLFDFFSLLGLCVYNQTQKRSSTSFTVYPYRYTEKF